MPPDPGFAVVVVVHLDPNQVSLLPELLQECTPLRVRRAEDRTLVQANEVYVIQPGRELTIANGVLRLGAIPRFGPIDTFLRSLAEDRGAASAAVILSGTGSDGTHGVRAVKNATAGSGVG